MKPDAEREVVLYTRHNCSLCDDAARELRALSGTLSFTLAEVDIDADASLREQYNDVVPVVAVGDRVVAHAPIVPGTLRDAIAAALR